MEEILRQILKEIKEIKEDQSSMKQEMSDMKQEMREGFHKLDLVVGVVQDMAVQHDQTHRDIQEIKEQQGEILEEIISLKEADARLLTLLADEQLQIQKLRRRIAASN